MADYRTDHLMNSLHHHGQIAENKWGSINNMHQNNQVFVRNNASIMVEYHTDSLVFIIHHSGQTAVRQMGKLSVSHNVNFIIPPPNEVGGGVYWIHLVRPSVRLSVCPSVRPSVCRRHGFRSISQVCFGISISNFICILTVATGRSLLIFSDVTFKMAAWRPYWIFWFPDSNFTSALNINFKLQRHNTYVYG